MDILQSINPNLLAIAIVVMMVAFIIMMAIYIPRVEKLRELENDKKRYKAERDYAVEQWSIAMISGNRQKDKILNDLKNTEDRKNQYSKIAKTMAEAYDKLKGQYGIDISKQEYDIITLTDSQIIPYDELDILKDPGFYLNTVVRNRLVDRLSAKMIEDELVDVLVMRDPYRREVKIRATAYVGKKK